MKIRKAITSVLFGCFLLLPGCSVNPVTGERNFQLYGSDWEQQVGAQMYSPMKQSQGGEFILDPDLTAYVSNVGQRLAGQARRKGELDYEFSILNSSVPNAWALPGGKIVINRGLLTRLNSEMELAAVLGHEIIHADAAHGARQQSSGMLAQIGAVASMVVLGSTVENPAAREIAMMVPTLGVQLIMQKYGRDAEREADQYGMIYMSESGYDPEGAVRLQRVFLELSEERNEDWLSGLFASHPPSRERLDANRKTAATLPPGGDQGIDRYRDKTAFLRRVQPAYELYDEASKAISDEELALAQSKISQALAIEPREALFHALQGDLNLLKGRKSQAGANYQQAIRANEKLFYPHLRQGQLAYQLREHQKARSNLERSLELLPTAEAHYTLGRLEQDQGRTGQALEHYRVAAQSRSEAGMKAQQELIRLDIGRNPSAYVQLAAALDARGRVIVALANPTSLPLTGFGVDYAWVDDNGRTRTDSFFLTATLPPGEQITRRLNLGMTNVTRLDTRFRAEVKSASVLEPGS